MSVEINCAKCQSRMQEGFVIDHGDYQVKMESIWVEGKPEKSFWSGLKTKNREMYTVRAFRCPNCHYLEFYTAEEVPNSIWT
jgi:predicted nucleic-acid-binding Zn-ribbon protein